MSSSPPSASRQQRESSRINTSLSALGAVIKALSTRPWAANSGGSGNGQQQHFVPYRNSVLTWLLKECLGACVVPPSRGSSRARSWLLRRAEREAQARRAFLCRYADWCILYTPHPCPPAAPLAPLPSTGGNSRTAVIATVSPCASAYAETLSTLRYADAVKRVVTVRVCPARRRQDDRVCCVA